MDAAHRHSASPDCSDGNDAASAPSEFLAEFLSAIMRRQYAEALKYCRLILQYEPHNATALGFYPLLQHKLHQHKTPKEEASSSEEASLLPEAATEAAAKAAPRTEVMEQEADESGSESSGSSGRSGRSGRSRSRSEEASCASQSSLELDSSSPSVSLSRRTDRTDRTEPTDSTSGGSGASAGSGGCWDSAASRSEPDDNGNEFAARPRDTSAATGLVAPGDVENDNAAGAGGDEPRAALLGGDAAGASLQRLRAQFACSIK